MQNEMQKILITECPYEVKRVNRHLYTNDYSCYKNNLIVIDNNFELVCKQNSDLKEQITILNGKIDTQNLQIESLAKKLEDIKINVSSIDGKLSEEIKSITSLSDKLGTILSFIPYFMKWTTKMFTNLIIGVKSDTLDQIEIDYDHKLLEHIL